MAASLRKKIEIYHLEFPVSSMPPTLGDVAENVASSTDKVNANVQPLHLIEPALIIVGNEYKVYYAYPSSLEGDINILGPDKKFSHLTTRSVQGIFKPVRLYGRMLEWGIGEEASSRIEGGL